MKRTLKIFWLTMQELDEPGVGPLHFDGLGDVDFFVAGHAYDSVTQKRHVDRTNQQRKPEVTKDEASEIFCHPADCQSS